MENICDFIFSQGQGKHFVSIYISPTVERKVVMRNHLFDIVSNINSEDHLSSL